MWFFDLCILSSFSNSLIEGQYKTRCGKCKAFIKMTQDLLEEIAVIEGNQVISICGHCKHNKGFSCQKCNYLQKTFLSVRKKIIEENKMCFKSWLLKVKQLLYSIKNSDNLCKHLEYKDFELERILRELEVPLTLGSLNVDLFPNLAEDETLIQDLVESKEMLRGILSNIPADSLKKRLYLSDHSFNYYESFDYGDSCICKLIKKGYSLKNEALDLLSDDNRQSSEKNLKQLKRDLTTPVHKTPFVDRLTKTDKEKQQKQDINDEKRKLESVRDKETSEKVRGSSKKVKDKSEEGNKENLAVKSKKNISGNKEKKEKRKPDQSAAFMFDLIKKERAAALKQASEKSRQDKEMQAKLRKMKIAVPAAELPQLPLTSNSKSSSSLSECDVEIQAPEYTIIGTKLEPYIFNKDRIKISEYIVKKYIFDDMRPVKDAESSTPKTPIIKERTMPTEGTGMIKYRLSNKDFINNGWTKLPSVKIMRQMNIFKTSLVQSDWFERHKSTRNLYYDTGEVLADIDCDKNMGKLYYKNGELALEYRKDENSDIGDNYVIYSFGEARKFGKVVPRIVLALFDFRGNGIIYDMNGNTRLKFNQSEGMVVDPKIGPPCRWKWHMLNDPPVLNTFYINTRSVVKDPLIETLEDQEPVPKSKKETDEEKMLEIEFDNFVKDKAKAVMQNFTQFHIKMKAVKINDYFSVKILDQSKVYLLYRCGSTSLKLNLGIRLNSSEIIDSIIHDPTEIATPYDTNWCNELP